MRRYLSRIVKREEVGVSRARPTVFPGGPLTTLTEDHYYVVAILEPVFQIAIMRHQRVYHETGRAYWVPYSPPDLPVGSAFIVPFIDLGEEVTF